MGEWEGGEREWIFISRIRIHVDAFVFVFVIKTVLGLDVYGLL